MLARCAFTVRSAMSSWPAISLVRAPRASARRTSRSRERCADERDRRAARHRGANGEGASREHLPEARRGVTDRCCGHRATETSALTVETVACWLLARAGGWLRVLAARPSIQVRTLGIGNHRGHGEHAEQLFTRITALGDAPNAAASSPCSPWPPWFKRAVQDCAVLNARCRGASSDSRRTANPRSQSWEQRTRCGPCPRRRA